MPKISAKLNGDHLQRRQMQVGLSAADVAENWRLSTRSVVNLARLQIYYTFAVLQ